ncbi:hypothetical protein [Bacillus sp. CECT 9360]|nr:hypothetical protein [Bacillus sp. CECT 9360]CAH0344025.1 hypothetical protein BCI9360_00256 [Bacillus sp. CECT 9360]
MLNIDIDQLLEATAEIADDGYSLELSKVDIDKLLDNTMDW